MLWGFGPKKTSISLGERREQDLLYCEGNMCAVSTFYAAIRSHYCVFNETFYLIYIVGCATGIAIPRDHYCYLGCYECYSLASAYGIITLEVID